MIRPDISKLRKKYESLPKEKALAGIEKVILDYKRELVYFETSDLNTLNWLKTQTKKEHDEYMKPILQNKPPPYIHDNEPETPLIKRLDLQGRYNQLQRNLIALEGLKQKIQSRPSEEQPPTRVRVKPPPKKPQRITFSKPELLNKLFEELKGFFPGRENDLRKALKGEKFVTLLNFPHNQNKLVEVFRRAKYNGIIISDPHEIRDWLCQNFTYFNKAEQQNNPLNPESVSSILYGKSEPTKKARVNGIHRALPPPFHRSAQRDKDREARGYFD